MSKSEVTRNEWIIKSIDNYRGITKDKDLMIRTLIMKMLAKTVKMFKYTGLPDTIKVKDLETQLQVNGYAVWKEVNGNLYTFRAGLGGFPSVYYLPTIAIIANPALQYNASLKIDEECVLMLNDYYYQGMMALYTKYAELLTEAEISLRYEIINARIPALIQADNDTSFTGADKLLKHIENGDDYGIIATKEMFDGITTHDYLKISHIKDLIEATQYIKGSWYNEIGINAAFNMKREAINEFEAGLNEDILYPTIDLMLECRQVGLEKVNKMYGTNIIVELDSIWKDNREDDELVEDMKEAQVVELEALAHEEYSKGESALAQANATEIMVEKGGENNDSAQYIDEGTENRPNE